MGLKDILKAIKLNEGTISMILGAVVVVVVGIMVVNYFRGLQTEERITREATTTNQEQPQLPTEHSVAQGENLWTIAEKYYGSGYNWVDIAQANNLANSNRLLVDQKLTIPQAEKKVVVEQAQAQAEPQEPAVAGVSETKGGTISGEEYTVVKGDHLWGIAVRSYGDGYKWVEIARANDLANPDLIHTGNVLKLPR